MKSSRDKLVLALRIENAPEYMIERAKNGYYSDYDSPLEMPCVQLVNDCHKLGLTNVTERAKNGDFDATKQESDEWYEREGKQLIKDSGLPPELFERSE